MILVFSLHSVIFLTMIDQQALFVCNLFSNSVLLDLSTSFHSVNSSSRTHTDNLASGNRIDSRGMVWRVCLLAPTTATSLSVSSLSLSLLLPLRALPRRSSQVRFAPIGGEAGGRKAREEGPGKSGGMGDVGRGE